MNLGSILGNQIKKKGLGKSIQAALVCEDVEKVLQEILPTIVLERTEVVSLKDFVITIKTISSVIAQEIKLHENEILLKLRDKFGENSVQSIKYLR